MKEYKIIILDDVPADAELMERELQNGGVQFVSKRVSTKEEFIAALNTFTPDIILSDYNLPQFDGLQALQIAKEKFPDVPLIFVTGSIGDERAVEALRKGASDYVLKDKLIKLVPTLKHAFRDVEEAHKMREKVLSLELLNQNMIGRELKMVELKKEVEELKAELEKIKTSKAGAV